MALLDHHFRTDLAIHRCATRRSAFKRRVLSPDGTDLAAALQTIREIGDGEALNEEFE